MRLALNVLIALLIAFSYGAAGGLLARELTPYPTDGWAVTEEYDGEG